jgi:hypothetical protein
VRTGHRVLIDPRGTNRPAAQRVNRRIRRNAMRELCTRVARYYRGSTFADKRFLAVLLSDPVQGPKVLARLSKLDERDLALVQPAGVAL